MDFFTTILQVGILGLAIWGLIALFIALLTSDEYGMGLKIFLSLFVILWITLTLMMI